MPKSPQRPICKKCKRLAIPHSSGLCRSCRNSWYRQSKDENTVVEVNYYTKARRKWDLRTGEVFYETHCGAWVSRWEDFDD